MLALNQLHSLQELNLGIGVRQAEFVGFELQNLKKLTLRGFQMDKPNLRSLTIDILRKNQSVTDLEFRPGFPVNSKFIGQQKAILETAKNLKRYACHPDFSYASREEILNFLPIFVSTTPQLESLSLSLHGHKEEIKNRFREYFRKEKPNMKLEDDS